MSSSSPAAVRDRPRRRASASQLARATAVGGSVAVDEICDVTDERRWRESFFEPARPVDVLVNNAGVAESDRCARTTLDEWRRHLDASTRPALSSARAPSLPGMLDRDRGAHRHGGLDRRQGGRRATAAYTASKHAAVGLMRAVAGRGRGDRRDRERRLPDVRAHTDDRALDRPDRRANEAGITVEGPARPMAPSTLGRLGRAGGEGSLGSHVPHLERQAVEQRTGTRRRRRRDPAMSPFRASAGFTQRWQHFGLSMADGIAGGYPEQPDG